jgi:hypothetical protein
VRLPPKTHHYHGAMSDAFRRYLRALPDFPENLPDFDTAAAPADPAELFRQWLAEALAAGEPQPHACSLATVGDDSQPSSRMLILKDIDDDGWHIATSRTSRKGRELSANPKAALNFCWPLQERPARGGRQSQSGLAALRHPAAGDRVLAGAPRPPPRAPPLRSRSGAQPALSAINCPLRWRV